MKNTLLFSFIATFFCCNAFSQNLVVNPSFEITSSNCTGFGGEGFFTDLAGSWDNANSNVGGDSCSSPDLFSACNIAFTNMPGSTLGYQYSRTGTRHAGLISYEALDEYREYIQGRVSSPLVAGQTYCVSFYISLANAVPYATNNIGVYFSNTHYMRDPCPGQTNSAIYVTPQLNYTCSAITDTTANWMRLQWDYTATGGESYFIIGNFFNNAGTTVQNTGQSPFPNPFAYYYIDDVSITQNSCCFADILQHPDIMCVNDAAITLSARTGVGSSCSSAISGTWSGTGITNTSTGVFNPSVAGAGTHTITYNLNCGGTATTTIIVDACAMTVCLESNGAISAINGTGPFTWENTTQYEDCSACFPAFPPLIPPCSTPSGCNVMVTGYQAFGGTGATTTSAPAGYPVRVTDAHNNTITINTSGSLSNCSQSCTLTLSTANTPATCGNPTGSASVNVTAGTGPYTYLWSPGGATTSSINNVAGGNYSVTVTSQGGACTQSATVTVPESGGITLSSSATQATCGDANGSATVNITAGTGPFTYLWSPGGATTATASGLAAGDYTVTVSGANSCTSSTTVTVTSTNAITLSNTATPTTCGENNGTVSTSVTTGTGPFTYLWSPGGATTASVSDLASGNYTVTVSGSGCTATGSANVASSTPLTVTPSTTNANCNQSDGSASVTVTGGSGNYTYDWSNGETTSSITGVPTDNYDITVDDGQGCTNTQTIYVPQNTSLTGSTTGTGVSCANPNSGSVDLTVSGGTGPYAYAWSPGGATTQDINGLAVGTYSVTVTDNNGCEFLTSYDVLSNNTMQVTSQAQDETCKGYHDGTIDLTVTSGTGPYTYVWTPGGATTEDRTSLSGGNYSVVITDQGTGCTNTQSFTIADGYPLSITQSGDTLTATSAPNYQWYHNGTLIPGATSQTYEIEAGGYYYCIAGSLNCQSNTIETSCICTNSINENSLFEGVSVFPNPATDELNVVISLKNAEAASVTLLDVTGRRLWLKNEKEEEREFEWKIPVTDIAAGTYFVQINAGGQSKNVKVLVKD